LIGNTFNNITIITYTIFMETRLQGDQTPLLITSRNESHDCYFNPRSVGIIQVFWKIYYHYFELWHSLDFIACTITHLYMRISVYFINVLFLRNQFECNDTIYISIKRLFKKTYVCGVSNSIKLILTVNKDV